MRTLGNRGSSLSENVVVAAVVAVLLGLVSLHGPAVGRAGDSDDSSLRKALVPYRLGVRAFISGIEGFSVARQSERGGRGNVFAERYADARAAFEKALARLQKAAELDASVDPEIGELIQRVELFLGECRAGEKRGAESSKAGNQVAAVEALRVLTAVQDLFSAADKDADGTDYARDLSELSRHHLVSEDVASGLAGGYRFSMTGRGKVWSATAAPHSAGETGDLWFFVDQTGIVRFSADGPADQDSEPLE